MEIGSRVSQAQYPETAELVSSVREIVRSVNPDYSALPARIADQMQFFCQPANCPPALDNPVFADLANVPTTLSTQDLVVAVEYNRTVKLYPLAALRSNRVVNDWIGATPIAVTYSPGTGALRVFKRMTGETATKLRFTGQLRFGNEVLYDLENGSLWQQYTGEALTPAAQAVLAVLPHSEMTLEAAKKKFPEARIIAAVSEDEAAEILGNIIPLGIKDVDGRLSEETKITGLVVNGEAKAYEQALLEKYSVIKDVIGGNPVVIANKDGFVSAVDLRGGKKITPLQSYWFAWSHFYPSTHLETLPPEDGETDIGKLTEVEDEAVQETDSAIQ